MSADGCTGDADATAQTPFFFLTLRDAEVCKLVKVDTKENLADPFTKMFTGEEHARLRELYMFEQQMPVSAG